MFGLLLIPIFMTVALCNEIKECKPCTDPPLLPVIGTNFFLIFIFLFVLNSQSCLYSNNYILFNIIIKTHFSVSILVFYEFLKT